MKEESLLKGKKVLLVDDEPDVLDTVKELLQMCDIVKAVSFEEGRNLLDSEYFDVAILDIMGVGGYDLLKIAKEKGVMAVMLTAHALTPESLLRSIKEGAASFLPKEEVQDIAIFLVDILEARERGKNYWWRWTDRLDFYWEKKFGANWKDKDRGFWKKFPFYE